MIGIILFWGFVREYLFLFILRLFLWSFRFLFWESCLELGKSGKEIIGRMLGYIYIFSL